MLFNSPEFLLLFLPLTVLGFYALGRFGTGAIVLLWLIAASLVFHAYWKASYTWLFVASVLANHVLGRLCRPPEGAPGARAVSRKVVLL
jgi:hypothetical protein